MGITKSWAHLDSLAIDVIKKNLLDDGKCMLYVLGDITNVSYTTQGNISKGKA